MKMSSGKVLYAIVCGAGAASDLEAFVLLAQGAGWHVRVIATPMGAKFLDMDRLAALTGGPVRTDFREPHETSNGLPPADAVVVAPATFNTINKWALGITDTVAVGMLCEHLGMGVPTLAVPQVKAETGRPSGVRPEPGRPPLDGRPCPLRPHRPSGRAHAELAGGPYRVGRHPGRADRWTSEDGGAVTDGSVVWSRLTDSDHERVWDDFVDLTSFRRAGPGGWPGRMGAWS